MFDVGTEGAASAPKDAIAVIGMGCRFPGANSVDEFWRLLDTGKSMMSEPGSFPTYNHPRSSEKSVFHSNLLDDIGNFDHRFFKKSSREAASMDPQQRLLLEVSYQALESSGFFGPRKPDLDVGCFLGVCASDYNDNVASHPSNAFSATGTLRAFVSGRVSHFFGFTGPSIGLDTACSSSAVAIDAACKAILHGDCKAALAGGVSVFTSPFFYQNLSSASFLSATGASKSFDASADGYCRGEGVGLVVLKRLSQAIQDGDDILGTILSTSVRQSSNKVPITVPYSPSQTALYRKLLNAASLEAGDVTYVEAHGTGTPIGDPLEYEAIKEVFGNASRREPLHFASVKGNIGHTEGASGVAGLIKTLLMMQHRAIPRQANFVSVHPKIQLIPGKMSIPTSTLPWTAGTLNACVNNYGASGSIAAMIVQEAPQRRGRRLVLSQTEGVRAPALTSFPLIITANSAKSLGENCAKLRDFLLASNTDMLSDLAFNLSDKSNRTLPLMFTTSVSSASDLAEKLSDVALNPDSSLCQTNPKAKPVILTFGGQTARSIGLSRQVYQTSALLRKYLNECNHILQGFGHPGILPSIFETEPTDDVVLNQSMQFAIQYACAKSWIACGLKVDCILGHSFGQLVALTVAGSLSLVDGLKLVYGRAVLMRDSWGLERGSMVSIEADREVVMSLISPVRESGDSLHSGLEVACFNGPRSYVLVGSSAEIDHALVELVKEAPAAKFKVLDVTHGFHSKFCDPILADFHKLAQGLTFKKPEINVETCSSRDSWSTVTPERIVNHTRNPVYFADAVQRIAARHGACTWLEAGSNTSITSMARRALSDHEIDNNVFCPINLRRDDALNAFVDTTVKLWRHGHHVQFWPFHHIQGHEYQVLSLPPYQFEKVRHWLDFNLQAGGIDEKASAPTPSSSSPLSEPVLITFSGFQEEGDLSGQKPAVFTIDPRAEEWRTLVSGHSVLKQPLCPASLYVELVMQAARQFAAVKNLACTSYARVDDLEITSPFGMSQDKTIQLVLSPCDIAGRKFDFTFLAPSARGGSEKHAVGKVEAFLANDNTVTAEFERTKNLLRYLNEYRSRDLNQGLDGTVQQPTGEAVQGSLVYKIFSEVVTYHDYYHGVRRVASGNNGTVLGEVCLPEPQPSCTQELSSMPVAMDNFFQVAGLYANCLAPRPVDEVFVCTQVGRIQLSPDFEKSQTEGKNRGWDVFAMSTTLTDKESSNDIFATDHHTGELVFIAYGVKFNRIRTTSLAKVLSSANPKEASTENTINPTVAPQKTAQVLAPIAVTPSNAPKSAPVQQPKPNQPMVPAKVATLEKLQLRPSSLEVKQFQKVSVEAELREIFSKMTDMPAESLQGHVPFEELGVDSLMVTEIVSEVYENFKIEIPRERIQDLQTIEALCKYIDNHNNRLQIVVEPQVAAAPSLSTVSSNLEKLTNGTSLSSTAPTSPGFNEHQDTSLRLAGLLGGHLDCPASDFERSTNLAEQGLDSLLTMELMSDVEKMFGVSIDLSGLSNDATFGHLVDILASALGTLAPSTNASTPQSSKAITPIKVSEIGSDDAITPSSKPLANAAREFEQIKSDFDRFADQYKFSDFYTKVHGKQQALVLAYVVEAYSDLGVNLSVLKTGEKIPQLDVIPKHAQLLDVFLMILRDGNLADYDGSTYVRSEVPVDTTHSSILLKQILTEFPQHVKEHTLLSFCGPNMSKFLSGKVDPLSVLFGNKANRSILEDVYTTAPMFIINSQLLTSFLEKAMSKSAPGPDGKYHIVELGAGTGATTRWVVERLVERGIPIEYTFTDISSVMVSKSKNKFNKFDCIKYGTIDIEKEPPEQYLGRFDIALATNCIHATSNLYNSLTNINKLLRPHGLVSLVELTTRNYWLDMVFGLLDGWWLYDDGRPYVLATPELWEKAMQQTGFQHVSWTGGHTRESEICRVITGFKRSPKDQFPYGSLPQKKAAGVETVVFSHTDKKLPLRADVHYPSPSQASASKTWVTGTFNI